MGYLVLTFFRRRYRLSEVIKLLFSYTKFLGSSVVEEVEGQWSVSSTLLAFHFFFSLVTSLTLFLSYSRRDRLFDGSYLLQFLLLFEYLLLFTSRIVNLFSQVVKLDRIRHIMRSFKLLDEILLSIDCRELVFDGPPVYRFIINIIFISFYFIMALSSLKFKLILGVNIFHTFYLPFVMNADVFNFCILVYSIQVNLTYLNSFLERLKTKKCKDGKLQESAVEYCCKAYNVLCSQVDHMNTVYGLQLLLVFMNNFTVLLDVIYHLIFHKFSGRTEEFIGHAIVMLVVLAFIISVTYSITSVCDRAVVKAREFNTLLYQVMVCDRTSLLSQNKKIRLHVSMKREMVFTAYGFFSIDYSLVHSIAAAVTTYLVILIQFSEPTNA